MKSKTSSVRLLKETYDDIDSICDDIGCTRNDWIKEAIDEKLEGKKSQDQEVIEDTTPEPKSVEAEIIETIEEPKATLELIPEPKITIKEVPQDNSEKPCITYTQLNGKLLPFAQRYNI